MFRDAFPSSVGNDPVDFSIRQEVFAVFMLDSPAISYISPPLVMVSRPR